MLPASAPDFQSFQRAFARHLRDPQHTPRPAGVPRRRMLAYQELLFNNICSFLDPCFPLCHQLLGETRWRQLNRRFYRDWPLHTPWFREIPREFTRYLAQLSQAASSPPLSRWPRWLPDLAHYEWAELAADIIDTPVPPHHPDGDLLSQPIVLNPALLNLRYDWPVHRIGIHYRPRKPVTTHLLVLRDRADTVQFIEINPVTARLLALLAETPRSGTQALAQIAQELQHPNPERLHAFGAQLLDDLQRQEVILGTRTIVDRPSGKARQAE